MSDGFLNELHWATGSSLASCNAQSGAACFLAQLSCTRLGSHEADKMSHVQMGDRTNLVMILAGELLRKAEYLLTMGLHPSEVVLGYELARDRAMEELESMMTC